VYLASFNFFSPRSCFSFFPLLSLAVRKPCPSPPHPFFFTPLPSVPPFCESPWALFFFAQHCDQEAKVLLPFRFSSPVLKTFLTLSFSFFSPSPPVLRSYLPFDTRFFATFFCFFTLAIFGLLPPPFFRAGATRFANSTYVFPCFF